MLFTQYLYCKQCCESSARSVDNYFLFSYHYVLQSWFAYNSILKDRWGKLECHLWAVKKVPHFPNVILRPSEWIRCRLARCQKSLNWFYNGKECFQNQLFFLTLGFTHRNIRYIIYSPNFICHYLLADELRSAIFNNLEWVSFGI